VKTGLRVFPADKGLLALQERIAASLDAAR